MNKKDKNKIITTSIMFVVMLVILFISVISASALIETSNKEIEEAGEAIALVFVYIILLAPLLLAAIAQLVPGIINIIVFKRLKDTTEDGKIQKYSKAGTIISIVLTIIPVVLAVITILLLQGE